MIWWFLILGISTLVVVCVAIAIYVHLRKHLQKVHDSHEDALTRPEPGSTTDRVEH